MADNIKKSIGGTTEVQDALDIVGSSLYGLSPGFIRKNEKLLDDTRRILSDKLANSRASGSTNSPIGAGKGSQVLEFVNVLTSAMRDDEKLEMLRDVKASNRYTQPSGSHILMDHDFSDSSVDRLNDSQAVDEILSEVQSHFALMPEYSKICEIIPELGKAVEVIVRDIINRDEFTHSFITNFYKDENETKKTNVETKVKDLLQEYDFESRVRRWLTVSEVAGVKPFSVLPQDDIVFMINDEIKRRKQMGVSNESLIPYDVKDLFSVENFLLKSPLNDMYQSYENYSLGIGMESTRELESVKKSIEANIDPFVSSIVTSDIVDDWESVCLEEFNDIWVEDKISKMHDERAFKESTESMNTFLKNVKEPKNRLKRESNIKKQIRDLVVAFDRSIEVIDPLKGHLYEGSKSVKNTFYKNKAHEIDKGIIENFYRQSDGIHGTTSKDTSRTISINGFSVDVGTDPIDPEQYKKSVHNRRAILTEYEPEHVVPISANGVHIGYYVVEYIRTSGDSFMMMKKDRGSFLDIIRRIGIGEDKALTKNSGTAGVDGNNPFSSGVFSPSTIMSPGMGSGGANNPYSKYGSSGKSSKKMDLIKTILVKTITKRLGDESLIDNGTFQSSLMNLVRDDILFRNNIRFTFIPESHMVYMSRELDSDGYPLSVFNGTLFSCYTYISSLISSLMLKVMKSNDTEVMEVNVGKSNEIGLTIGAISRNASTRNVSARTLFGGTDSIVRSVGSFNRRIVPVIDGQKLYDITQVEKANDVEIDDEFTERNLKSVIMKIGVPPTTLDMLSQDEYVASQTQHRLDYRNIIVDRGVNYSKFITKAIKLIVNYSDVSIPRLNTTGDDVVEKRKNVNEIDIDIKNIDFHFTPPKALTVTKISEEMTSASDLVDAIIKSYYGDESRDGKEWPVLLVTTRKLLMREFASSTDWARLDELILEARRTTPKIYLEMQKYALDTIDDGESSSMGGGDDGGDGGDGFGGDDMGMDFGDGDTGGGDDTGGDGDTGGDEAGVDDSSTSDKPAESGGDSSGSGF